MKKKAIIKITIISVVALLAILFSFLSFNVAGKNYEYVGFARALNESLDFNGGYYADYNASGFEDEEKYNKTIVEIESILSSYNVRDAKVLKSNDGKIRIEAPKSDSIESVLTSIGAGELKIRTSSDASADVVISGSNVVSAYATQYQTSSYEYQWGAFILFDDEGKEALANATNSASSSSSVTLYMFRGDNESSFFQLQISEKVTAGYMFISSSSMTEAYASSLALELHAGSLPLVVNTFGEVSTFKTQNSVMLGVIIASGALLLAVIVLLVVRYRELGLLALVSLVLFAGLSLFLMQAIDYFELSITGLAGLVLSLILFTFAHIYIFENIKKEYAIGRKISTSVKNGFNKSNLLVVDASVIFVVLGLLVFLIGGGALKAFGISLFVCSILSLVISLVITRTLAFSYLAFNKTNNKRLNLTREEGVDEIGWFFT